MALFTKGQTPHNKGKKQTAYLTPSAIQKSAKTRFKTGQKAGDKNNTWKGGVQTPKNDCVYIYTGVNKRERNPRLVYEDYYGEIPKGWIIYHLDGNKHNDEIYNLIAIPRAVLIKICSGRINGNFNEIQKQVELYFKRK